MGREKGLEKKVSRRAFPLRSVGRLCYWDIRLYTFCSLEDGDMSYVIL